MANNKTLTSNRDVDYLQKDFDSVSDAIITYANVNFGKKGTSGANRLWTNFNASSFSRNWLEIVAFTADSLYYYFDQQATQSYLQTATIRSAVRDIAKQFGFEPATATSASGNVVFTFTGAGTINRGFRVASSSGTPFFLTNNITATAAGEITGTVLQGTIKTQTLTAKGLQNEEFDLEGPNVIVDKTATNANDLSPILTVNGNTYDAIETFIRSNGTDTPAVTDTLGEISGGGGRVFQIGERPTGNPFIRFGDGVFGRKLLPGETITVTYRSGGGSVGNAPAGTITTLVDNVSFVTAVRNDVDFSGGADEQSIEELRDLIPASLRTLERAVAKSDYSDLILTKFNEVSAASTEANNTDPGIDLNIYVVPQGNSISAITDNAALLTRLNEYIDARKMVTVQFQILDAFGISTLISLEVFINNTASRTTVTAAIQTALLAYFDLNSGGTDSTGIGFSENILLKDINNIVQDIDGVERFEIKKLSYRPRIQKNIQGLVTDYKSSEVDIFPNIQELEWLVAASGQKTETTGTVIYDNDPAVSFTYDATTGKVTYATNVPLTGVAPGDSFRNGPGQPEKVTITTVGDGAGAEEKIKITTKADQQGVQEVATVQTESDVAGSLGGTFFTIFDQAGSVGVWFNVDALNSKPSMGTNRDIEIALSANDNANSVASAIAGPVGADSEFSAVLSGVAQETEITATAPASITDSQYFLLNSANDGIKYYVWFDKSGSAVDPLIAGRTGIEVDISLAVTDDDVATAIAAAIGAPSFSASSVLEVVTVTNTNNGPATAASNVNVGGAFVVATTILGTNADTVTITNAEKLTLFDIADGAIPTNFTINTTVQGIDPDTLESAYFDIADAVGDFRVWFSVGGSGTAPANPGTLVEVPLAANDTANDVASKLETAISGSFTTSVAADEVTIENLLVGLRNGPTDGTPATGFTFEVEIEGADPVSLDGQYFILPDVNGGIAFWFDVAPAGTSEPLHGQARSVEITTVTGGMTADAVALEIEKAITSTGTYASELNEISKITTGPDISGSLNNKHFFLNSANDAIEYYVWYNVGGAGSDPSIAGKTGIPVAIIINSDANVVAAETRAVFDAVGGLTATIPGASDEVVVTNDLGGKTTDIVDADSPNGTGFTLEVIQQGATILTSTTTNVVTVTHTDEATIQLATAGTTGFTVQRTQTGVADDTDFPIQSVDLVTSEIFLNTNEPVNAISAANAGGSIRNGATTFESFKVFKKILNTTTNLSIDSITDSSLDLSVDSGTGNALSARVLIDNTKVFVPSQHANGDVYLVDGAGNVWEIEANTSNTITTSITAVNDAAISNVSAGDYKIVSKLVGKQVVFNGTVFNIQYNSDNTLFSAGAQFTQIGTIGDTFEISEQQVLEGKLGIAADIIAYNLANGEVRLNDSPDLQGISSGDTLIDSSGQTFSITAVDNRALPLLNYDSDNKSVELVLQGTGVGSQYSQGFQVATTETYSIVSAFMKRQGNIVGNLTARIVLDDGSGLPDVTQLVAISNSLNITDVSESDFEKVTFSFTNPPSLSENIQYHLIVAGDIAYNTAQQDSVVVFDNTLAVTYSYNSLSGIVQYDSAVDLSAVQAGNFLIDNDSNLHKILSVDDSADTLTLSIGLVVNVASNGNVLANDNVLLAADDSAPTFASGEMSQFDNADWSNSTTGPNQFSTTHDMVFTVEGPKSIRIDSNLTPVLGPGATISTRYYDDVSQISFILGLSTGIITSATDVNPTARGTVGAIPDSLVDHFVFRTSRFSDDIVNLRLNEIPQLSSSDLSIQIFGGVQ